MKHGALFLDRDGTIIEHVHFLHDPAQVRLGAGAREALREARARGWLLFVLTNQSGVGRGYFTLADVEACNRRMLDLLDLGPDVFAGICIAPEAPDQPSRYRKPRPDFILEMMVEHDLDPASCVMVGDMPGDWRTGINAGIAVLALSSNASTPATRAEQVELGVATVADLPAAVAWLEARLARLPAG
jgi:D-glycero-D-manno-heptose 1,7-bisphosphate phosphatase